MVAENSRVESPEASESYILGKWWVYPGGTGEGEIHILNFDPYPSGRGRATIESKAEARFPHCFLASEFAYQSCFHVLFDPSAHRIC